MEGSGLSAAQDDKQATRAGSQLGEGPQLSNGQLVLRMLGLAWRYRLAAVRVLLLQVVLLAMALSGLGLTGLGIDVIHTGFDDSVQPPAWPLGLHPPDTWSTMAQVVLIGLMILTIALMRMVLDRTAQISKAALVQDIVVHLRATVYHKLERLSFRFFDDNESGSIINRVTGDVQAVRAFIDMVLIEVLMMALSLTFFLVYMVSISGWLTLLCLLTTPLLVVLTVVFSRIVRPAYMQNRLLFDHAVRVLAENVQGVHVVKGFSLEELETDKFKDANDDVTRQQRWIFWRASVFVPLIQFLPQVNLLILMLAGGWLYIQGGIELGGGLIVFAGLLQQFSNQVGNIANIANTVQRSLTGAQRVFEVMDTPLEIESPPDAKRVERARGAVRFENATFGYDPQAPAVRDVSLDVAPGRCVAVLGATGAGKSTLLSLIPRFYDPQRGRVLIDGVDVREYDLDDLRRSIGIVFQESFLFSHTVAENIAFGYPDATREQVEEAAKIAQAHDFILEDLPHGYDTVLTEGGENLSGGQRQRLAIARAVLLQPPILLLDDPTAAIDPETEHEILAAMDHAMEGRTTFVVAHRLSTLRRADQVIVMEKGRIVEAGTHDELMNGTGHYRTAADLQSADDESKRLLGLPMDRGEGGGA